ncbi:hypothetical protein ENSA5_40590 [Enhygromyxa salina]|uniref:Tryptophan synthase alpha chain n=1 Tax=Enhygromyxa salina TaxID=215803 RepID=A0A2S9XPE8_9BACT|nr:hypothetical protein [Enhygromyxa salina]PRP94736.1 hypothetical protein ENSA5_40590 [Enhygromyxa salina]
MRAPQSTPILRLFPLLCAAALVSACGNDTAVDEDAGETTAASSTASDTTSDETSTDSTTDSDTTTSTDDGNFVSEEGPDTGMTTDVPPGNLGDQCMTDAECAEDLVCNGLPGFGGVCSECAGDTDCPDGSNCTFMGGWFTCGDGGQGQMCESDVTCADDLYCAEVIDLGGLFNGNFCSECSEDGHCANGQLCAPQVEFMDLMNISGQRACIDPGTAPNDSLCDAEGAGDEQCEGFCTTADLMGFIQLGVCGECETDGDCMMGSCMPAMIGFDGFSGSVCG